MRVLSRLYNPVVKFSKIHWNIIQNHTKTQTRVISLTHQNKKSNPEWGSKKGHRKIILKLNLEQLTADPKTEEILAPFREAVKEQVSWNFFNLF